MEPLDVVEDVSSCLVQGPIASVMDTLSLEYPEEALASSIIATVPDCAHATYNTIAAKEALIIAAGELAAAIRMQNDGRFSLAMMHRPPHHQLAKQIQNHTQE